MKGIAQVYQTLEMPPEESDGIFLAGPTMRDVDKLCGWRKEAIGHFFDLDYKCDLYVPEFRKGKTSDWTYDCQVLWEISLLTHARVILFWIPRSDELPARTTNIEFGEYVGSNKIVVGCPDDAPHMEYIRTRCKFNGIPVHNDLKSAVMMAKTMFEARRRLEMYEKKNN